MSGFRHESHRQHPPLGNGAKAGDATYQAYYHCYDDRTIPDQYEQTVPQVFPNTAPGNFTWCEEMHKWVLTTFHDYQWDLNYANPAVFVDMTKSILHLANLGVEVFRIDAVPYIWKQLGTTCRNLPQVHTTVRMLRMVLECVCPAVILKGEVVMAPKELAAYFAHPKSRNAICSTTCPPWSTCGAHWQAGMPGC